MFKWPSTRGLQGPAWALHFVSQALICVPVPPFTGEAGDTIRQGSQSFWACGHIWISDMAWWAQQNICHKMAATGGKVHVYRFFFIMFLYHCIWNNNQKRSPVCLFLTFKCGGDLYAMLLATRLFLKLRASWGKHYQGLSRPGHC